jgi:ketosteroid isomerase-like protein
VAAGNLIDPFSGRRPRRQPALVGAPSRGRRPSGDNHDPAYFSARCLCRRAHLRGAARAATWFASFAGPIGFEMRDLTMAARHDVVWVHSLDGYTSALNRVVQLNRWVRATSCFCRVDGKWLLTHAFRSMPFGVATGQASIGLRPSSTGAAPRAGGQHGG